MEELNSIIQVLAESAEQLKEMAEELEIKFNSLSFNHYDYLFIL